MKHKRGDGPEKQGDEAVDVTPAMICVFVVMCCCALVLLYLFYDQLGTPAVPARPCPASPRLAAPAPPPSRLTPLPPPPPPPPLHHPAVWLMGALGCPLPPSALSRRLGALGQAGRPFCPHCRPAPPCPAVFGIIGIFCLASSTGLYSCLSPWVQRLPFCTCR